MTDEDRYIIYKMYVFVKRALMELLFGGSEAVAKDLYRQSKDFLCHARTWGESGGGARGKRGGVEELREQTKMEKQDAWRFDRERNLW